MARLVELGAKQFVRFLSDLWTQRNWQTKIQPRGEGRFLVQGQRADGTKGMMLVLPDAEAVVSKDHVRGFVAHAKKRQIDVVVVATQGEYADEVRGLATNHDVKLLDRDELGETVENEAMEESVKQYTDGDVYETAEVEFGLPFDLPEPIENALESLPLDAIRERLGDLGGGSDGGGSGGSSGGGSLRDRLPSSLDDLKSGSPPSVRVVVVAVLLLVLALGSVAALGPAVNGSGSSGGPDGVALSALSTASSSSADMTARWNAQTTSSITVGNNTYTAPDGEQFVVVALNVTNQRTSPGSLPQSAVVFESDSVRYSHQPLQNVSSFSGGLFAPNESKTVWTIYTVPEDTTTGTLVVQPTAEDTVAFVYDDSLPAEPQTES
ncbi:restriction endonuclease [Haloferax sp. S1W]|uniref:restriction endonuclease n=1 Tax=Haloferax sp. S1W TaxID=3377110 RepID=UPI0037C8DDB0